MSELEICDECGEPTGNSGEYDDSLYLERFGGPYCDDCYADMVPVLASAYGSGKTTIESQAAEIAELVDCLKDMEKGDDGHAWKVARRLIEKYGAEL